jgi:YVTN family beta-propeller protein
MKSAILYGPLFGLFALGLNAPAFAQSQEFPTYQVGPQSNGTYVMSTGQIVAPAGTVTILGSPVRAKSVALNPAKPATAAVLNMGAAQAVQVVDTATGNVLQNYSPFGDSTGDFTGITYSPDGTKLLFSQDDSYVAIAHVDPQSGLLSDYEQLYMPPSEAYIDCQGITVGLPSDPVNNLCGVFYNGNDDTAYPSGLVVSSDNKTAYALLNQNNTLQGIDLTVDPPQLKGKQIRVGNVPNSAVLNGTVLYVSNEGGRPAKPKDFTNISSGTPIVASQVNGSAVTGTVSVIDTTKNHVVATIAVGLHPTGMAIANGNLYVCNTSSDSISVISLATNTVTGTISLALPINGKRSIFGAQPTAITIVGSTAYVTLYTLNAVAVVDLNAGGSNAVLGYIPTASTPAGIAYNAASNELIVSNDKGVGTWGSLAEVFGVVGYNSHQDTATINLIPVPNAQQLQTYTQEVYQNNHWDLTQNIEAARGGDPNVPAVAIPKHVNQPSLIQHVFVIVRENRTYDQILGDVPQGNGDPALTIFGQNVTPNAHLLVQRFPLLDNYYDPSRQSADGHNWLVQAIAPYEDDIQSPDWVRSYPANGEDAMAYQPRGFLWDAAEKKGLSFKTYGEYVEYGGVHFTQPNGSTSEPSWTQWYNDALSFENGQESQLYYNTTYDTASEIPSVQNYSVPHFPVFDLGVPDQWRVDKWYEDFSSDVTNNTVPNLETLWIMCDHTGGPPTDAAEQADNDLAVGRIVDIISHSPVWGSSAIFITEDDAQDGVDHVDGHRSPGYVVSPYVVQNQGANHTFFTQVNMTRTIEQILGLPPMNQFDLVASPMYNLFTNQANTAAWTHVPNNIPLNQGVGGNAPHVGGVAKAWGDMKARMFNGNERKADAQDPNTLNHMIWYENTGYTRPYPGETKVRSPEEFKNAAAHPDIED